MGKTILKVEKGSWLLERRILALPLKLVEKGERKVDFITYMKDQNEDSPYGEFVHKIGNGEFEILDSLSVMMMDEFISVAQSHLNKPKWENWHPIHLLQAILYREIEKRDEGAW